mgnify:CR=1 FL=1
MMNNTYRSGLKITPIDGGRARALTCLIEVRDSLEQLMNLAGNLNHATLVLFNPNHVVGNAHVTTAVDYAVTAFRERKNIARSLHVEAFLFAAATNEISEALELFRPQPYVKRAIAAIVSDDSEGCFKALQRIRESLETVGVVPRNRAAAEALKEWLKIEDREIGSVYATDFVDAIERCILSRMTLLFLSR